MAMSLTSNTRFAPFKDDMKKKVNTYMLFAGWEVRMVKNCDRGLENHHTDRPLAGK